MRRLQESWSAFSDEIASAYLRTFGAPAPGSKDILADVLRDYGGGRPLTVLDLGCGNGQLYGHFADRGLDCDYTGVDFSEPLLAAARQAHPEATFVSDDVETLERIDRTFDVVVYSHVIEMLESPHRSLARAHELTDAIAIRFFEPPEFEFDAVELRDMDLGAGPVPYLRRKMSHDYYRLILADIGCSAVDVYRDVSKDQVHFLHF